MCVFLYKWGGVYGDVDLIRPFNHRYASHSQRCGFALRCLLLLLLLLLLFGNLADSFKEITVIW